MRGIELWHLKRFCKKHNIDIQEIDNTLTHRENKKHLQSLIHRDIEDRMDEWKAQEEHYMRHHFLTFYINQAREGPTKSEETGEPIRSNRFSLAEWIQQHSHVFWGGEPP